MKDSYIKGIGKVGGIIGAPHTSSSIETPRSLIVDNCVNYATVFASSEAIDGVGGIVGAFMCASGSKGDASYVTGSITNCVNYGKIYTSSSDSNGYAGGITGRLIGYPVSLSNCANFGEVSTNKAIAGGIIGQVNFTNATEGAVATVKDCYNAASVSATHVVGGITGRAYANTTLENCVNIGTVTGNAKVSGNNKDKFGSIESTAGATYINNYYLENSSYNIKDTEKTIVGAGNVATVGTAKTAAEIHSESLATALGEAWTFTEGYLVLKSSLTAGTVAPEVVEPEATTTEEVTTEATPEDVTTATPDATETEAVTTTEEVTTEASSEPDTNVVPTPPTKDSNAFTYVIIVAVAVISMITLAAIVMVKKENN